MIRPYTVTLSVLTTYETTIDANTPEEAAMIVERDFEEGIPLDIVDEEIESTDVEEAGDEEEEEG